ncbi:extracellular solute-binding protein [Streptococcus merionis]|uniref:extracellular solute-binding protein n=1 Tax=Streptococcus merionis TaxID=400065 RepID=UPI0035167F0C
MNIKKFLKGISIGAFASLLVACGNSSSSDAVELEYFSQKPEMQETLREIIKDFEKENPEIKIKFSSVPDAETVLKTRMANGEEPDIINVYPVAADFIAWAEDGRFLELSDDAGVGNLKEGAAEFYAVQDKIYSLPLNTNVYGIYYNKDKFNELGLEVPQTQKEFKALVETIKSKNETPFALSLADSWTLNGFHQLAWVSAAGGYDGAQDLLVRSAKGGISADSGATQSVIASFGLLHGNGQSGFSGAKYADAISAFAEGKALMMPQGSWAAAVVNQQNPDLNYGTFAFPGEKAGEDLTIGGADLALSISAKTKHPEEAKKFLNYLSTKEVMQKYYDVDGSPTSVIGVETDGKFPEIEGIAQYAFTDKQVAWLHKEWDSQNDFWTIAVETTKNPDATKLAKDLNAFFDPMKK